MEDDMKTEDILPLEGANLPSCMRHFGDIVSIPNDLYLGDIGLVVEFEKLLQEEGIVLKTEIDNA